MRLLDEAHLRVLSEGYLHQASCRWRRLHSRDVAPSCARRRTRPRFHLSMVLPKDVAKRRSKSGGYAAAAPRRRPRCSSLLASQDEQTDWREAVVLRHFRHSGAETEATGNHSPLLLRRPEGARPRIRSLMVMC